MTGTHRRVYTWNTSLKSSNSSLECAPQGVVLMREAVATSLKESRGSDGRRQAPHPLPPCCSVHVQGFWNSPHWKWASAVSLFSLLKGRLQADLFALFQLISIPKPCKPQFIGFDLPAQIALSFLSVLFSQILCLLLFLNNDPLALSIPQESACNYLDITGLFFDWDIRFRSEPHLGSNPSSVTLGDFAWVS